MRGLQTTADGDCAFATVNQLPVVAGPTLAIGCKQLHIDLPVLQTHQRIRKAEMRTHTGMPKEARDPILLLCSNYRCRVRYPSTVPVLSGTARY
jgi:hypothetical protein